MQAQTNDPYEEDLFDFKITRESDFHKKDKSVEQLTNTLEISETVIDEEPKFENDSTDVESLPLPSIKRKIQLFNSEIDSETNDSESDQETFEFDHSTPKNDKANFGENLDLGSQEKLELLIEKIQEKADRDLDAEEEKCDQSNFDNIERKTPNTECNFENSEEAKSYIAYKPDLENLPSDSDSNTNAEYSNDSLDSDSEPEMTFKLDGEFENSVEITEEVSLENSYELENDQVVELALRRHRFHKV